MSAKVDAYRMEEPLTIKIPKVIDLTDPGFRRDPFPIYAQLRLHAPVARMKLPMEGGAWLVTRYEDVQALSKDPRLVSGAVQSGNAKYFEAWWVPRLVAILQKSMINRHGDDHRRLRALVHQAFTPSRVQQMAERTETVVHELLDAAAQKPEIDLIADFALPLPMTIVSEMIGIPQHDQHNFHRWTSSLLEAVAAGGWRVTMLYSVGRKMMHFFEALIQQRQANPQDDLLTALVQAEEDGDRLSEEELISMIFLLLLAGYETTVNLIGNGTLALLEHPDQRQKLYHQPELIESAIEELLRFSAPVDHGATRYATEEIELHGRVIPQNSAVILCVSSANRDETVFENADQLNIERHPNKHLAFGHGVHYCLGAPLARLEGQIAIQTLVQRFPHMQLAVPVDQLKWRTATGSRGLKALPMRLKG